MPGPYTKYAHVPPEGFYRERGFEDGLLFYSDGRDLWTTDYPEARDSRMSHTILNGLRTCPEERTNAWQYS